jgi:hypothetical protein
VQEAATTVLRTARQNNPPVQRLLDSFQRLADHLIR